MTPESDRAKAKQLGALKKRLSRTIGRKSSKYEIGRTTRNRENVVHTIVSREQRQYKFHLG